jgi:hypothetical protein
MKNFLKTNFLTVTMPSLNAIDFNEIMKTIASSICALILALAVIWGGYELFLGFSDHNSSGKQKGLLLILGGIVAAGLMFMLLTSIFGIVWITA